MRRFLSSIVVLLGLAGPAFADGDPHAEMAAALAAQIDLEPTPIVLPTQAVAPHHAAAPSAVQRGIVARATADAMARAAEQAQAHTSQALAHEAQAAAAAAAGQAQSQAARDRATHHPAPRTR